MRGGGAAVNSAVRNGELCDYQRKCLLASQGFLLRGVVFCISTSPDTNVSLYAGARHMTHEEFASGFPCHLCLWVTRLSCLIFCVTLV